MPKVSVAMAVYNGEMYLREQMDSIIKQLGKNDEIVISYDESTDRSLEIIENYIDKDNRIKLLFNPYKGVVSNFQNAISNCSNEIIFYSDQDDIWLDGKIDRVCQEFKDSNVTAVIHDSKCIDNNMNITCESTFRTRWGNTSIVRNFLRLSYIGCSMAFRKEMLPIIVPIPTKERSHDWWTGTMCGIFGRMVLINEPYILHRIHDRNATPKKRPGIKYQIQIRWIILKNAVIRCFLYKNVLKNVRRGIPITKQNF